MRRELTEADLVRCLQQAPSGFHIEVRYPGKNGCYGFHTWGVNAGLAVRDISSRRRPGSAIPSSIEEVNQHYREMVTTHGHDSTSIECLVDPSGIGCGLQYLQLDEFPADSPVSTGRS